MAQVMKTARPVGRPHRAKRATRVPLIRRLRWIELVVLARAPEIVSAPQLLARGTSEFACFVLRAEAVPRRSLVLATDGLATRATQQDRRK